MYLWAEKMAYNREMASNSPRKKKRQESSSLMEPNHNIPRLRSPRPSTSIPMAQSESDLDHPIPEPPPPPNLRPDRPPTGIERTAMARPGKSGTLIMMNIFRAMFARTLFIVHSMTTIWMTADVRKENEIWGFALISVSIIIEGSYAIIMRAGDERRWFSPSVLLYIMAAAPPIWLLEIKMCEWRSITNGNENLDIRLQLLEQLLLVVLILARWLLPKGKISREQLSQILLAYLAMSSDIVEFFDVFKEKPVYSNETIQYIVLSAWTLSLLQFPFVLTMSRARKMRVAITDEPEIVKRRNIWSSFNDIDLWAILLANSLQDIPFLLVRLYLVVEYGLLTYTMAFFICKNALIIALQTYRAFVLFNDRYLHPRNVTSLEATAAEIYDKQARRHNQRKQHKNLTELEKIPIYNNNRRPSQQKIYGTNHRSPSRSPHRNVYRQVKRSSFDE